MTDCIFCQIIAKTAPSDIFYEDDQCLVIRNINPLAPTHLLVLPKKHFDSLNDMTAADETLAGHLLLTARLIAERLNLTDAGYRLAINSGRGVGQTVFHLHVHLLSGCEMDDSLLSRGLK